MNEAKAIGLDNGYYNVKACTGPEEQVVFPSVVSAIAVQDLVDRKSFKPNYRDSSGEYLVGQEAVVFGAKGRPDLDSTKYKSNEYRVQALYALKQLGVTDAHIVCGAPVQFYSKNREDIVRTMMAWGGKDTGLHIHGVRVLPEPMGTYLDMMLNWDGSYKNALDQGVVGIVDIGGNTVDLVEINRGRPSQKYHGLNEGIYRAYTLLYNELVAKFPDVQFNLYDMDRVMKSGSVKIFGRETDVGSIVRQVKKAFLKGIIAAVKELWKTTGHLESLIFTGGAAQVLEEDLRSSYPHTSLPDDPVFANARGFCKSALLQK